MRMKVKMQKQVRKCFTLNYNDLTSFDHLLISITRLQHENTVGTLVLLDQGVMDNTVKYTMNKTLQRWTSCPH